MAKIGVFVCQCGNNIARTVDTADVAKDCQRAERRSACGRLQIHVLGPWTGNVQEGDQGKRSGCLYRLRL